MDCTKPRKYLQAAISLLVVLATIFAYLAGCVGDPEWTSHVSEGEIQFSKQDYFSGNTLFDHRIVLPNEAGVLFLYGYTILPGENNEDYYLTLRIMVEWPKSDSPPIYQPSDVSVRLGGVPMAIIDTFKKTYEGRDTEGKQWKSQYIRIRFSCNVDSLKEVAKSRGLIDAQIIKIDLSKLMMIDGKYVPIDPIYAQDSREVSTISEKKQ